MPHEVGGQIVVGDVLAVDVEAEAVGAQTAPVGEGHLGIELHPVLRRIHHGGSLPRAAGVLGKGPLLYQKR